MSSNLTSGTITGSKVVAARFQFFEAIEPQGGGDADLTKRGVALVAAAAGTLVKTRPLIIGGFILGSEEAPCRN